MVFTTVCVREKELFSSMLNQISAGNELLVTWTYFIKLIILIVF